MCLCVYKYRCVCMCKCVHECEHVLQVCVSACDLILVYVGLKCVGICVIVDVCIRTTGMFVCESVGYVHIHKCVFACTQLSM